MKTGVPSLALLTEGRAHRTRERKQALALLAEGIGASMSIRRRLGPPIPTVVERSIADLKKNPKNARKHSEKQIKQLSASIVAHRHLSPLLIDEHDEIIAGHGRYEAIKRLGYTTAPCIVLTGLLPHQKISLAIADNKIAANATWDMELLKEQLIVLAGPASPLEVELTGFSTVEIDTITGATPLVTNEDELPEPSPQPVTLPGEMWALGDHRIICGDTRLPETFEALMGSERARMVFQDPPYNVPIEGHVSGLGRAHHREFAMASGEMTDPEFANFLHRTLTAPAAYCLDGAILYSCMDWRHVEPMLEAGAATGLVLKNLIVWAKNNAGMGTFYRSQHELIFAFKKGRAPHINNFGLGDSGRYRTNVWEYPGANTFRRGRMEELSAHPTPKPVALVADAIKDVSNVRDIVIDGFGGSGTTLIAAERTRRRARLVEFEPLFVDLTVSRWEALTGKSAVHHTSGKTFNEIKSERTDHE